MELLRYLRLALPSLFAGFIFENFNLLGVSIMFLGSWSPYGLFDFVVTLMLGRFAHFWVVLTRTSDPGFSPCSILVNNMFGDSLSSCAMPFQEGLSCSR